MTTDAPTEEQAAAAGMAEEVVLPVILRHEEISKPDLQEETGLGTSDLRAAVAHLVETGAVEGTPDGDLRAVRRELEPGAEPELPADPGETADPEGAVEEPEEAGGEARFGPDCRVRIVVDVALRPELREGEDEDAGAIREAEALRALAASGIADVYPELSVSSAVESVSAYTERRIYPDG